MAALVDADGGDVEVAGGWHAQLHLRFARRGPATLLAHNAHRGPLRVQKALYPEGPGVCHVAVLHPPSGIAAGDSLVVTAQFADGTAACLTTPGAAKWYRSRAAWAQQSVRFRVGDGASLEWLPRENILFDASRAWSRLSVELSGAAKFLGWEILCFGRRAAGETWRSGALRLESRIRREGRPLWAEHGCIDAGSGFAASPVGLMGCTVSATLMAAGGSCGANTLAACRLVEPKDRTARVGITALPEVLLARYLGHSSEDAFQWFVSLRQILRPALLNMPANPLRLWSC